MDGKEPIPAGVYYSAENANFYSVATHHGQGTDFYKKWVDRAHEFPTTSEAVEKPGMKIIAADNFDRDHVADELVAENVPIFYAQKIVDYLNVRFGGDNAQRIYKVVLPDYKLHKFEP